MSAKVISIFIIALVGLQPELAFSAAKTVAQACDQGDLPALKKLVSKNVDLRGQGGETPLIRCVSAGQAAAVAYLVDRKAALNLTNSSGRTALAYAVSNHQDQIAQLLISKGADVGLKFGEKKENLLFEAIRAGALEILPVILKSKPSIVNDKNVDGESALFEAVRSEQSQAAVLLLKSGADRDIRNNSGLRAIDLADPKIDTKIIAVLKAH